MKKIIPFLLILTSVSIFAETYQFKKTISKTITDNVFTSGGVAVNSNKLIETGTNGNIALIGYNGLTESSYTASSNWPGDVPVNLFDGGYDIAWSSAADSLTNQWIQVDFGQQVFISGFLLGVIRFIDRMPDDITIQVSDDGLNFTNHEDINNVNADIVINLDQPVTTRYFRLFMKNTKGSTYVMQFLEMEIYQVQ